MTSFYTPGLTEYTVVFRANPRPDGAHSFRTIYAYTQEEAVRGIHHLRNADNIVEIIDAFPTIRN